MDETTRLHPGTRDEIWMHMVKNFHNQELWPQIFIQITDKVTRNSRFASTATVPLALCEVSSEVDVNLGPDAFQANTDDHITMLVPSAWLQMCVCVFACRWLPGRVHHAVEHRCAGCGGLCQPQVCLQSAFQLGLYIGITVSVWPCVSQPLCFLKLGFISESLCVSLTCVSQPLCFLKLGFILESLCVSLTCVSQPLCFLKLGFILESLCVSLTCVSQPLNWVFILESLCPSDHVFRLCWEDVFCTSQCFAAKLSQVVHERSCQQTGLYCWRIQQCSYAYLNTWCVHECKIVGMDGHRYMGFQWKRSLFIHEQGE